LPKKEGFENSEKRVKEGRSLNRNEVSWSQKCVAGTKQERRETLVVQSGKIVASLFFAYVVFCCNEDDIVMWLIKKLCIGK
jgi:hypothetical protein